MSEEVRPEQEAVATEPSPNDVPRRWTTIPSRLTSFVPALRAWSSTHWSRAVVVASVLAVTIALTIAVWVYLATIAFRSRSLFSNPQRSLAAALEALDRGEFEQARAIVRGMLRSGDLERSEYGGPLYVLGAVKTNDAETALSLEKRRTEYLVASRYLSEARFYGLPLERKHDALYLLGKSLLESNQFAEGLDVLENMLALDELAEDRLRWEIERQLAEACVWMPYPRLEKALEHATNLRDSPLAPPDLQSYVLLLQAHILSRLGRAEEAQAVLASVPNSDEHRARVALLRAQIVIDELDAILEKAPAADRERILAESHDRLTGAISSLEQAEALDTAGTNVIRSARYLLGRSYEFLGQSDDALRQYQRTRQFHSDSLEAVAAALAEADLLRRRGDNQAALLGYRRVLESISNPQAYRSVAIPLDRIRRQISEALAAMVDRRQFDDALALLTHVQPLFSRTEQLEFRSEALQRWGELLLSQSTAETWQMDETRAAGLRRLREAGAAYEELAKLRFATEFYANDLWTAAENFYRGQSFTRTIDVLNQYLEYEPQQRNAQTLLRLGQAHLARNEVDSSIAAFEECIEFHPLDGATYQARIDCAKAYWQQGDTDRAEQLLRDNIVGSTLKPSSREWKDSLFALGMLLHETDHYDEAIGTLEEAVERYPQDSQTLLAHYMIGDSYRRSAEVLLERMREARITSERDVHKQAATERLNTALERFNQVQRAITLRTHDVHSDPLMATMLRNCYMIEGTVLFELGRYEDAIRAFSNVSSLYPNEPFVLEPFVQIANCWRRLGQPDKARGAIQQALIALDRFPSDADFAVATAFNKDEWRLLLNDMERW